MNNLLRVALATVGIATALLAAGPAANAETVTSHTTAVPAARSSALPTVAARPTGHAPHATAKQPVIQPAIVNLPADGYVRAWTGTYRGGTECAWSGNASTWGTCENKVGSVEDDGYVQTYDDVNFYWGESQYGAWACIGVGSNWMDLSAGQQKFTRGPGLPGYGQNPYNNIASHAWTYSCA